MKSIRIYQVGEFTQGQFVELSPEAVQHVSVVLRMKPGQHLVLFNGNNQEYAAIIHDVQKRKVIVSIERVSSVNRESPRQLHLAQALSKGDKMEFVVQKATELGVTSITPILTSRCVVKLDADRLAKKRSQWQAIAIAACEQSGRNTIPIIYDPCSLIEYVEQLQVKNKFILFPGADKSWRDYITIEGAIALLIGPEGGFDEAEINIALQAQFKPLSLGPRILRTETAALAALSILQAVMGDL